MTENNDIFDKKNAEKPSEFQEVAKSYRIGWRYAEYAFQYGAAIVLCSLIGYWLDNWLNTGNILLIVGVLIGSVGGFLNLIRALDYKAPKKDDQKGKDDPGKKDGEGK